MYVLCAYHSSYSFLPSPLLKFSLAPRSSLSSRSLSLSLVLISSLCSLSLLCIIDIMSHSLLLLGISLFPVIFFSFSSLCLSLSLLVFSLCSSSSCPVLFFFQYCQPLPSVSFYNCPFWGFLALVRTRATLLQCFNCPSFLSTYTSCLLCSSNLPSVSPLVLKGFPGLEQSPFSFFNSFRRSLSSLDWLPDANHISIALLLLSYGFTVQVFYNQWLYLVKVKTNATLVPRYSRMNGVTRG